MQVSWGILIHFCAGGQTHFEEMGLKGETGGEGSARAMETFNTCRAIHAKAGHNGC